MKIAAIRKLVDTYSIEELKEAEQSLYNEARPGIEIEGEDEGEMLTHVLGAISIKEDIASGTDPKIALRNFTQRVRNSLS